MKLHQRSLNSKWLLLLIVPLILSGCGRSRRNLQVSDGGANITEPINNWSPDINLGDNGGYDPMPPTGTSGSVSISAFPSAEVAAGEVIFLAASWNSAVQNSLLRFNYSFEGTVPAGISFVDSPSGVRFVRVKNSSSSAATVVVRVRPADGSSSVSDTISLKFNGSGEAPNADCRILGPYQLAGSRANPTVGQSSVFYVRPVSVPISMLEIDRVWTNDNSERAYFYQGHYSFSVRFNSPGQKTLFVQARIGRTNCNTQMEIQVSDSESTQTLSLSASSGWVATGVYVDNHAAVLNVSVSGSLTLYRSGTCPPNMACAQLMAQPISSGPEGTSASTTCKAAEGSAFKRLAVLGKIGSSGTPFLVGPSLYGYPRYGGQIYLRVNDGNCDRVDGVFTARVGKGVY